MALNIAVPLSGVGDFFEGFGLLSPISPISVDCRENLKLLVSPIGSESSGVSSLDSEESKEKKSPIKEEEIKITYKGRNILDLHSNLNDNQWKFSPALLPDNNFKMYLANRSQYHRLSNTSHIQDYSLLKCQCCDFRYPVENYKYNLSGAAAAANHNVNVNNKNNYHANNNYMNINNNNNNYVNNNNNSRNYQSFKKFYDDYNKTETNFNNNSNNNNNNSSITYCLYRQF